MIMPHQTGTIMQLLDNVVIIAIDQFEWNVIFLAIVNPPVMKNDFARVVVNRYHLV